MKTSTVIAELRVCLKTLPQAQLYPAAAPLRYQQIGTFVLNY
ncbi:MAG: hypothetical protein WB630_13220 [Candidatus Acidiferrales bacterium]